jgi:hypothetical protein
MASQLPYALFRDSLSRCGIFFESSMAFPICHEPARAIRHLESTLRMHSTRLNEFISSMNSFFSDAVCFKAAMEPMRTDSSDVSDHSSTLYGQAETLLRILLRVQAIQAPLIRLLIDKMLAVVLEAPFGEENYMTEECEVAMSRAIRILNHIRWCEVIFDSSALISLLLETVHVCHIYYPRKLLSHFINFCRHFRCSCRLKLSHRFRL